MYEFIVIRPYNTVQKTRMKRYCARLLSLYPFSNQTHRGIIYNMQYTVSHSVKFSEASLKLFSLFVELTRLLQLLQYNSEEIFPVAGLVWHSVRKAKNTRM